MWLRSKLFWKICSQCLFSTVLVLAALLTALRSHLSAGSRAAVEDSLRSRLANFQSSLNGDETPDQIIAEWGDEERSLGKLCYVLSRRPDESLPSFDVTSPKNPSDSNSGQSVADIPAVVQRTLWREARRQPVASIWDPLISDVVYSASGFETSDSKMLIVLRHHAAAKLAEDQVAGQSVVYITLLGWSCAGVFLVVLVLTVVRPVQSLLQAVRHPEGSLERRDALLGLRERHDELGSIAKAIEQIEETRHHQQESSTQEIQSMREAANQMSAILQAMVEGVIAIDKDQSILFANDVACRLLDLDNNKAIGRRIFECVRSTALLDAVAQALTTGETVKVEFRITRHDTYLNLVVSAFTRGGVVLVLHDVTEIRRLEVLRKDFMNGVSHELKTPLTVIQACTDTMLNGAINEPETARRFLSKISTQSERLHQLIVGMLQLSRVESGQQVFTEEAVDLATISREQMNQLQPIADSGEVQLSYEGPTEAYVLGDQQAIRTIVNNLIDNALKYTRAKGNVQVCVREETDANFVCVRDNGMGISQDDQARIFERFYRVEKDRNRERGGTGLGLAIVKHLCHALKADVSVHSEPGSGTEFTVRFPFRDDLDEE